MKRFTKKFLKLFVPYGILILIGKMKDLYGWRFVPGGHKLKKIYNPSLGVKLVKIMRNDCKHPFVIRSKSTDKFVYKNIFKDRWYDFETAGSPRWIIDLGANIGLSTLYFANRFPDAIIIAVEPEIANYNLLVENTKPYDNVRPVQAAIWNKVEEIDVVDTGGGEVAYMVSETKGYDELLTGSKRRKHTIQAITIDWIVKKFNIERIDIIKIDVEGAEKELFENTSDNWIAKTTSMIVELHEWMKAGCNRAFYQNTIGFDDEWQIAENIFLSKDGFITNPNKKETK